MLRVVFGWGPWEGLKVSMILCDLCFFEFSANTKLRQEVNIWGDPGRVTATSQQGKNCGEAQAIIAQLATQSPLKFRECLLETLTH